MIDPTGETKTPLIRPASKSDLPVLVQLIKAYHEFEQASPYDMDAIAQAVKPLLLSDNFGRIWLIERETQPIGYIALCYGYSIEFAGRDAFVDEFFIVPEYRGQGLGRAVLTQIQSEAKNLDIKALHLEVGRTNERAQRLYSAIGFEPRERFLLMSHRLSEN